VSLAADRERALEIADRLRVLSSLSVAPFFGGAGIRLDELQFAFLIEGVLYFRVNDRSRSDYESLGAVPVQGQQEAGNCRQLLPGSRRDCR
jgi:TfoX/Sxy family transcriptional regulator of competence genes